jgi:hypothetical protein
MSSARSAKSAVDCADMMLAFSGGTSLSKGRERRGTDIDRLAGVALDGSVSPRDG